jgi:Leucine-rich repeat (LRR) protein
VNQLKAFLKMVHLAEKSNDLTKELESIQSKLKEGNNKTGGDLTKPTASNSAQFKKLITTLTIKSKAEYSSKFYATISQNLTIKSSTLRELELLQLSKLVINNCELKVVNSSLFDLKLLTHLDLSNNKLTQLDEFQFNSLAELNLSHNEIKSIGNVVYLPKLVHLDLSFNKLTTLDKKFCENFKSIAILRVNANQIKQVHTNFGYLMTNLINLYANGNLLNQLPYSFCHFRYETVLSSSVISKKILYEILI